MCHNQHLEKNNLKVLVHTMIALHLSDGKNTLSKEVCVVKVLPTDRSLVLHLLYIFEFLDTYVNKYKSWEKFDSSKLLMESVNKFLFC